MVNCWGTRKAGDSKKVKKGAKKKDMGGFSGLRKTDDIP